MSDPPPLKEAPLLTSWPWRISYGPADDRLHDFYIPALERSVRFDRATGFFSSAALAIAAAGIVRLIGNDGRMRLLCGAQLAEADVEAIRQGAELRSVVGQAMAGSLADPQDRSLRARLEALAWMVANGKLDIRVVLPRGLDGHPLAGSEAREYYHPKEGVFVDATGSRLAFSGSSNDSQSGWQWNYEVFSVYATWPLGGGADAVGPLTQYVAQVERRFESLWAGKEESWVALDIPEAAREKLLKYVPLQPPSADPLERRPPARPTPMAPDPSAAPALIPAEERLLFRFLREAPYLPGAHRIGIETSTVSPWPHQSRVVTQVVERFPESFLFCDEVGLGKTVEAGLALRQLVISGRVRRALILVPKSILKQWQEELYEKFVLQVPRYDGGQVLDVFDREVASTSESVWNCHPLLLASSQLAKRRDRQGELLAAQAWDLVIVDEAHHARRREFLTDRYRPNRLLELLMGAGGRPGLKERTGSLYLLTATPMQVHPVEVWDLLKAVGMGGRWGALQENFLGFFQELRKAPADRDWDLLLGLVRDFLDTGGSLDPDFCAVAERELGLVEWDILKGLPSARKRKAQISQLTPKARTFLDELIRRHTPLRNYVWRNTRSLLRRYREKGLLKENIPRREPRNEWVGLTPAERDLYERIEEYISHFYRLYEARRKGLGFVMTVYRRRLTSSFHALERSLERRRDFLRGKAVPAGGMTEDDLEQDDLDRDVTEELPEEDRAAFLDELAYIEDFIRELRALGSDSKLETLLRDIQYFFARRETLLVFTQYTDTMDHLREQLREVYGGQVACYSGRGGERWDGAGWVSWAKEDVKAAFRQGDDVKILLCTESASEGLNLQTCGVLINYDMPWNPMRVEQRIGRIDRIGQRYEDVWIRNYFYQDTVEAIVYQRLSDRIRWFEDVIGELQPILHQVGRAIESLAMLSKEERARRLQDEVQLIRGEIETRSMAAIDVEAYLDDRLAKEREDPAPVTLQQIERVLVGSQSVGGLFRPDDQMPGVHRLTWKRQNLLVTFSPEVFDRYPNTVQLLSYGNPLLAELLDSAGDPPGSDNPQGVGLLRTHEPGRQSLFVGPSAEGIRPFRTLDDLEGSVEGFSQPWRAQDVEAAEKLALEAVVALQERVGSLERARFQAARSATAEGARQVLVRTALIDIAQAQTPDLFSPKLPYGFGPEAVLALKEQGAPYRGLLRMVSPEVPPAEPADSFFPRVQGESFETLHRRREALRQQGFEILQRFADLEQSGAPSGSVDHPPMPTIQRTWYVVPDSQRRLASAATLQLVPASFGGLRIVPPGDVRPFENCVPLFDLKIAAGLFSEGQVVGDRPQAEAARNPSDYTWACLPAHIKPAADLFVAQVVGESMNRRIPNGAYVVFRARPQGSREGKVVLAQHRSVHDVDLGGHFTLKVYHSAKTHDEDGSWKHSRVILKPDSTDPSYKPIVLEDVADGDVTILAVLVAVIG